MNTKGQDCEAAGELSLNGWWSHQGWWQERELILYILSKVGKYCECWEILSALSKVPLASTRNRKLASLDSKVQNLTTVIFTWIMLILFLRKLHQICFSIEGALQLDQVCREQRSEKPHSLSKMKSQLSHPSQVH